MKTTIETKRQWCRVLGGDENAVDPKTIKDVIIIDLSETFVMIINDYL